MGWAWLNKTLFFLLHHIRTKAGLKIIACVIRKQNGDWFLCNFRILQIEVIILYHLPAEECVKSLFEGFIAHLDPSKMEHIILQIWNMFVPLANIDIM